MTTTNGSPRARALAAALRKALDDKGISARLLAERLKIDRSHLSRIVNGKRVPSVNTTALILGALGTAPEERDRIIELARNASEPNWLTVGMPGIPRQLAGAVESERAASAIAEWSPMVLPGLLQTNDYVRAIARTGGLSAHEVESRVMVRGSRREILTCRNPVTYNVLIDESGLRKPIGSPEVMTEQLRYLITIGKRSNITLRIVPDRVAWHPGMAGPFVLYDFPDASPFVHFEHHSSGAFVADSADVGVYQQSYRRDRRLRA